MIYEEEITDNPVEETEEELEEQPTEVPEAEVSEEAEEEEEEEDIILERIYTIPLRKAYWLGPRWKRANKAIKIIREFIQRHMKPETILIKPEVNEKIWSRGIEKPPRRIRVKATKLADGTVKVSLAEA